MGRMSAAEVLASELSEPLTWAEICGRHPDEWVCLVEIEFTHPNGLEFRTARVIGHGKIRRASLAQATTSFARYDEIGHFYTGHITETPLRPVVIIDDETRDAFRYPR
jgi:hypothetical protein